MTKPQIIFLFIVDVIFTYIISGLLIFILNKTSIVTIIEHYTWNFPFIALINGYPKVYLAFIIAFIISTLGVCIIPYITKRTYLFGNARFANSNEIANMKLYGKKGIIIGKYNNRLLRFGGQQFVALGAPTRSGKGVGIVIPNLMEWQESAVVQDIKQECFDYTSKYRKDILGQEIYLFNPFSRRTHRYNPLTYIDMTDEINCDSQLMDFANILYPLQGDSTTQFFNQLAQNLFIGLCYLWRDLTFGENGMAFQKEYGLNLEFSLYGILQLSKGFTIKDSNSDRVVKGFEQTYELLDYSGLISEITKRRLETYFKIDSANTKSGVMSSFNAPLTPFEAETLRLSTQTSDFDLRSLRKRRMTIYIGITPDQLANAKFILNIFWSQLILLNTQELPQKNNELKYSCLLVMDEFTAPGQIPILQTSVSFIAGYNLRLLMIYQSYSQLETSPPTGYGKEGAKTLLTNHACQIFYAPREQEDAELISKILGNKTVKQTSHSYGGMQTLISSSNRSVSEASRNLMLPQELREMPFTDEIITIDSGKPIRAKKAFYYNDPYFMNKYKSLSSTLHKIKGIPSRDEFEKAVLNNEFNVFIPTLESN